MATDKERIGIFNPFQNKPWFLRVCSTSLLKTLGEKEKLLVKSHSYWRTFCHCHHIQNCRLQTFLDGRVYNLSFGKGLRKYGKLCSMKKGFETSAKTTDPG